jgi:hypothetical protein
MSKPKMFLLTIVNRVIKKFVDLGPEGWAKKVDAVDKEGNYVSVLSKEACKFCNEGVVMCVLGTNNNNNSRVREVDIAFRIINNNPMIYINDEKTRTLGENLDYWFKLRSAIKDGKVENKKI